MTSGTPRWKEAINALTIYYGDGITPNKWRSPPAHENSDSPKRVNGQGYRERLAGSTVAITINHEKSCKERYAL